MNATSLRIHKFVMVGLGLALLHGSAQILAADPNAPFYASVLTDEFGKPITFNGPGGVAVDRVGNVYVSDSDRDLGSGNAIWKVTPSGVATIFAGIPGRSGLNNGPSASALFFVPEGLAVDNSGTVYVADSHNDAIRKISAGVVSTLATGFKYAIGVAVGIDGNVYVADTARGVIQKISPVGDVQPVVTLSRLGQPTGVAVDAGGNLFVTDDHTVRKITTSGVVTTLAGAPGVSGNADGDGATARFGILTGIAVDSAGNVYVADDRSLRKISPGGTVTTVASKIGANAVDGSQAGLLYPAGVATDEAGAIYVADMGNNRVWVFRQSAAPVIQVQPTSLIVSSGSTAIFSASAAGSAVLDYRWEKNGETIAGATHSTLVVAGATEANAGAYTCVISNSNGTVSSRAASLTVTTTSNPGRLMNLSVRGKAGADGQPLIVGFVLGGAGTSGSGDVLVRAVGPTLSVLGVQDVLADPVLSVLQGGTVVAANDNWATPASNRLTVEAAGSATGAFPFSSASSLDAALVTSLARTSGGYTAWVNGNPAGTTLAEIYDRTTEYSDTKPRLMNVSARALVGPAPDLLIAGFVIGGNTSKTVLVRAVGPALQQFGITNALPRPQLALHATVEGKDVVIATNSGWGGQPEISAIGTAVGAFAITNPSSDDAAIVRTLSPGAYTIHITGAKGDAGTVLVEIYDVP